MRTFENTEKIIPTKFVTNLVTETGNKSFLSLFDNKHVTNFLIIGLVVFVLVDSFILYAFFYLDLKMNLLSG